MTNFYEMATGTELVLGANERNVTFFAFDQATGSVIVRNEKGEFEVVGQSLIQQKPLNYFQGRPVNVGSILYRPIVSENTPLVVTGLLHKESMGATFFEFASGGSEYVDNCRGYLSWHPTYVDQFYGYVAEDGHKFLTKEYQEGWRFPEIDCYYDAKTRVFGKGLFGG